MTHLFVFFVALQLHERLVYFPEFSGVEMQHQRKWPLLHHGQSETIPHWHLIRFQEILVKVVAKSRRLLYLLTREQAAGFETDVSALGDLVRLQQGDHDRQVAQDQELKTKRTNQATVATASSTEIPAMVHTLSWIDAGRVCAVQGISCLMESLRRWVFHIVQVKLFS